MIKPNGPKWLPNNSLKKHWTLRRTYCLLCLIGELLKDECTMIYAAIVVGIEHNNNHHSTEEEITAVDTTTGCRIRSQRIFLLSTDSSLTASAIVDQDCLDNTHIPNSTYTNTHIYTFIECSTRNHIRWISCCIHSSHHFSWNPLPITYIHLWNCNWYFL